MTMHYSIHLLCLLEMYSTYWSCLNTETFFSCFILLTCFRAVGIYQGFCQRQRQSLKLDSSGKWLLMAAVAAEARMPFVAIHAPQGIIKLCCHVWALLIVTQFSDKFCKMHMFGSQFVRRQLNDQNVSCCWIHGSTEQGTSANPPFVHHSHSFDPFDQKCDMVEMNFHGQQDNYQLPSGMD